MKKVINFIKRLEFSGSDGLILVGVAVFCWGLARLTSVEWSALFLGALMLAGGVWGSIQEARRKATERTLLHHQHDGSPESAGVGE